jgi:hypothetical protein
MRRCLKPALTVVALVVATQAWAHHSFAATYLEDQKMTISGRLMQLAFRGPHSFVQVMVKEADGTNTLWVVEWGSPAQLSGQGVNRDTLKPGDQVEITGNPGRNPEDHRLRLLIFKRPKDGWSWGVLPGQKVD